MTFNSVNLYPQYDHNQNRRKQIAPVDVEKRFGMDRRQNQRYSIDNKLGSDLNKTREIFAPFLNNQPLKSDNKNTSFNKTVISALSPIVPIRRISSLPDNIEDGNYLRAAGLVGLMIINLPEDGRDLIEGIQQLLSGILPKSVNNFIQNKYPKFHGKFVNYSPSYNYREFQQEFSFIRGTMLEKPVNNISKIGIKLHDWDKSIFSTKIGEKLVKLLNIDVDDFIETGRKVPKVARNIDGNIYIDKVPVLTYKLKGNLFSKIIGWSLLRTTTIGLAVMALLEIPAIVRAFNKKNKLKDKLQNTSKQMIKSVINFGSIYSGISIVGGLLARKGHFFSLVGMAIGATGGAFLSNKAGKTIDTYWNTDR